jgi:hypothetical protein
LLIFCGVVDKKMVWGLRSVESKYYALGTLIKEFGGDHDVSV